MTTAAEMLRRVEAVMTNITEIVGEAIEQTKTEAIGWNQIQLLHGQKADGTNLREYRNEAYKRRKNQMNPLPPFGIADARYTGELYRGMFIEVRNPNIVFDSTSPHATFMIQRDGPAIFGLTPESKEKYAETYMPVAQRIVKERTGTI